MYSTSFISKKGTLWDPHEQKMFNFGQLVDKVLVNFFHETFETPSGEWVELNYALILGLQGI